MAESIHAASLDDVPPGQLFGIEINGSAIILANVEGVIYALDGICSHAYSPLRNGFLDGLDIECVVHGGRFDVRTGNVTMSPCVEPLRSYKVGIVDGEIWVEV